MRQIGKVAEVRFNKQALARGDMSVSALTTARNVLFAFNNRREGSFWLALGDTRDEIVGRLRAQLMIEFDSMPWAHSLLEFRVNFNDIRPDNLTWEGFTMANMVWFPLIEAVQGDDNGTQTQANG